MHSYPAWWILPPGINLWFPAGRRLIRFCLSHAASTAPRARVDRGRQRAQGHAAGSRAAERGALCGWSEWCGGSGGPSWEPTGLTQGQRHGVLSDAQNLVGAERPAEKLQRSHVCHHGLVQLVTWQRAKARPMVHFLPPRQYLACQTRGLSDSRLVRLDQANKTTSRGESSWIERTNGTDPKVGSLYGPPYVQDIMGSVPSTLENNCKEARPMCETS